MNTAVDGSGEGQKQGANRRDAGLGDVTSSRRDLSRDLHVRPRTVPSQALLSVDVDDQISAFTNTTSNDDRRLEIRFHVRRLSALAM